MFEYLLLSAALAFLSYLLTPKPEGPNPHSLGDFDVPRADPNKEIVVIWGTGWLKDPNVVWYGDLAVSDIESDGGKK